MDVQRKRQRSIGSKTGEEPSKKREDKKKRVVGPLRVFHRIAQQGKNKNFALPQWSLPRGNASSRIGKMRQGASFIPLASVPARLARRHE